MKRELTYRRTDGRRVALPAEALDVLDRYRQDCESTPEAGGVLLGRIIAETGDIVVDEVTEPTPEDARTRLSFLRGKITAQRRVDAAWAGSGGTLIYLGEWHSHPEPRPSPSRHDVRDWRAAVTSATYEQDALLFVIVGIEEIGVWELRRKFTKPAALGRDTGDGDRSLSSGRRARMGCVMTPRMSRGSDGPEQAQAPASALHSCMTRVGGHDVPPGRG